jgi:hypothetical protein
LKRREERDRELVNAIFKRLKARLPELQEKSGGNDGASERL